MRKIWNKLGFRKMDEMEQMIAFKAQRNAFLYGVLFLVGWSIYNTCQAVVTQGRVDTMPSLLLSTMVLVLIGSQVFYQHQLMAGTQEGREYSRSFWLVLLGGLLGAALIVAAGVILVMM